VLTEVGFAGTARFVARSLSGSAAGSSKVFLYQFTHVPLNNPLGAFHSVEIPYVFGNVSLFAGTGAVDQQLSAAIMGYWTRFAATGDPNGGGATVWPAYSSAADQNLQLGDSISVGSGLYKKACDLSDQVRNSK
jgi:para-nitrobenzyl esterase